MISVLQRAYSLPKKVDELKEYLEQCKRSNDSSVRHDYALLSTVIYLADLMLCGCVTKL